ncbi:T9SS type A sorting domain-containing protein [Chitinophagaceae bacterium LWZ2-11]
MSKLLRNLIPGIVVCMFATNAYSQSIARSVVCSAGETVTNPKLSITFIVGEPVADLLSDPAAYKYLSVGFAQPDVELKTILDMDISNKLTVFPNPATNVVKIGMNNVPDATYTIDLIDMTGRVLQSTTLPFSNNNFLYVEMNVVQYASGMYVIRVRSDKEFKGQVKLLKR